MAAEEQRSSRRINVTLPVRFLSGELNGELALASTMNISLNGICLSCTEKLSLGQEIEIETVLPTSERLKLHAKVIWMRELDAPSAKIKEYRIGLKIADSSKPDMVKFKEFYNRQLSADGVGRRI